MMYSRHCILFTLECRPSVGSTHPHFTQPSSTGRSGALLLELALLRVLSGVQEQS